jgi:hypothetical protein
VTAQVNPGSRLKTADNPRFPELDVTQSHDLEALFRLPPNEFTAARNALAERAKNAGSVEFAAHVRALTKPPLSAWVVNQLYWRHRDAFDRLIAAGSRMRRAQSSQLRGKGGDLREPLDARRKAMAELTRLGMSIARESGHAAGPDLLRRVTTTLDALATYAGDSSGPKAGQLTADVDAPGFDVLATLVPAARSRPAAHTPSQVLPFKKDQRSKTAASQDPKAERRRQEAERRAERAAAAAAVRAAGRELAVARKSAARAEADLKSAAARVKEAERLKTRLTEQMEEAAAEADRAREQARRVAAAAENAAQAVADAERILDEARRRQAQLGEK